jgi:acylphosphatase
MERMTRRIHVVVHGRVQGVGFRWATRTEAQRLGVDGWVRNRADGTVEAEVQGPDGAVERMRRWLASGPPGASVTNIDVTETESTPGSGFSLRDTL